MRSGRLLEVEYHRDEGLVIHLRPQACRIVPRSTVRHWRAANKELLMAVRSLLDGVIDRLEPEASESPEEPRPRRGRRQRVVVQEEESA